MPVFKLLRSQIADEAGPADLRFFDALRDCLADASVEAGTQSVEKALVLARLQQIEGREVGSEVVRRRIANLNRVASQGAGEPLFEIESRKTVFAIRWSSEILAKLDRRQDLEILRAGAAADALPSRGTTLRPRFLKKRFQVFVSHGWDDDAQIEDMTDRFVRKLEHSLAHLPERFRNKFVVEVFYDRGRGNPPLFSGAHP